MASFGALKRSMATTLVLVMGIFFVLIMVLVYALLPGAGMAGWLIVLSLTVLFIILQWLIGPAVVAWSTRLKYLEPGENTFLENMVDELCQRSGMPKPKLAIVENPTPNAFVFGRSVRSATLAVHTGLLRALNRDEIRAVLAHEIGHIRHRDVIIMTVVSAIPLLAFMIARGFLFSGMYGGRGRGRNAGAIIIVAIASYVIYLIAQLLVMRLSRLREHFADSYSALLTQNPHALSSALTKITYGLSLAKKEPHGARAFYIGDQTSARNEMNVIIQNKAQYDLDGDGVIDERELELAMEAEAQKSHWSRANELFSSHPPTFKRILMLKHIEDELRATGGVQGDVYKHI